MEFRRGKEKKEIDGGERVRRKERGGGREEKEERSREKRKEEREIEGEIMDRV